RACGTWAGGSAVRPKSRLAAYSCRALSATTKSGDEPLRYLLGRLAALDRLDARPERGHQIGHVRSGGGRLRRLDRLAALDLPLDGLLAGDRHRLEGGVLDDDVLVLGVLVALDDLVGRDVDLADRAPAALTDAAVADLVELVEGDVLALGRGVHADGDADHPE